VEGALETLMTKHRSVFHPEQVIEIDENGKVTYPQGSLQEQNHALQATNTKLTLRVRELEQDGKRLDWLERCGPAVSTCQIEDNQTITLNWVELDGGIMCEQYTETTLRQAIDKAMAEAKGKGE